ncbi:MAG: inosine monophosphate cyclohydrolase [Spirochaetales bacterium]|nr:inosine monophosphate cyclohydrolase [Spirochaetales bacterium]
MKINEYLCGNSYPGRLIAAGVTPNGKLLYAYAIMGRSTNSRNRVFKLKDGELFTEPFDASLVKDPSLIIYPAILKADGFIVVANGDQSLTIRKEILGGGTVESAIEQCTYEPDEPNYTPRISLVIRDERFEFAINRRQDDGSCERRVWFYPKADGVMHVIHTYEKDGNPLPSFSGDPQRLVSENDCARIIWDSLDKENRISLYVNEGGNVTVFNAREGD